MMTTISRNVIIIIIRIWKNYLHRQVLFLCKNCIIQLKVISVMPKKKSIRDHKLKNACKRDKYWHNLTPVHHWWTLWPSCLNIKINENQTGSESSHSHDGSQSVEQTETYQYQPKNNWQAKHIKFKFYSWYNEENTSIRSDATRSWT